jgi:hypothetical protein
VSKGTPHHFKYGRVVHRANLSGFPRCGRQNVHAYYESDVPDRKLTCPDCIRIITAEKATKRSEQDRFVALAG